MAKGDTTPYKTDVEHLIDGSAKRSRSFAKRAHSKPVPIDQRAIFEFTKADEVPAHIVWLCRKYGVTPQEVVHAFMRSEEMDPDLRARCAMKLMDEMRPRKDAEQGELSFTVVINHIANP